MLLPPGLNVQNHPVGVMYAVFEKVDINLLVKGAHSYRGGEAGNPLPRSDRYTS